MDATALLGSANKEVEIVWSDGQGEAETCLLPCAPISLPAETLGPLWGRNARKSKS